MTTDIRLRFEVRVRVWTFSRGPIGFRRVKKLLEPFASSCGPYDVSHGARCFVCRTFRKLILLFCVAEKYLSEGLKEKLLKVSLWQTLVGSAQKS